LSLARLGPRSQIQKALKPSREQISPLTRAATFAKTLETMRVKLQNKKRQSLTRLPIKVYHFVDRLAVGAY
jgi:hypothetical protein